MPAIAVKMQEAPEQAAVSHAADILRAARRAQRTFAWNIRYARRHLQFKMRNALFVQGLSRTALAT